MPTIFVVGLHQGAVPREILDAARESDWAVDYIEARTLTANSGRKLNVVARTAAADLYVRLHRDACAVLYASKTFVRSTPKGRLRDDRVIQLTNFCRYKALVDHISATRAGWIDRFEEWLGEVQCDGHNDPRCLPFHSFVARGTYNLQQPGERKRFEREHRALRSSRQDRRRVTWQPARARHGREPITVAGCKLVDGFHWDLTPARVSTVATADTLWRVKGYMNFYPDGIGRGGRASPLEWSRSDSFEADASDGYTVQNG